MNYAADKWLQRFLEHKNASPLGDRDPVEDRRVILSEKCGVCQDPAAQPYFNTEVDAEGKGMRYQCSECLEPWAFSWEFIYRGAVQSIPKRASLDLKQTRWSDVSIQFERMQQESPMETDIYAHSVMGFSIRDLARMASEEWPDDADAPKTIWKVRQAINTGRGRWARRLNDIGIRT